MTRDRGRLVPVLVAVLSVVGVLLGAVAATATAAGARAAATDPVPLVVVGVPGLAWSDLDREDLPALSSLVADGAVGSLTVRAVRSRACAVDGWLTLSSGRRAADVAGECRVPSPPSGGVVPGWSAYLAAASSDGYGARPGTLGTAVASSGRLRGDRRGGRRHRRGRRAGTGPAAP